MFCMVKKKGRGRFFGGWGLQCFCIGFIFLHAWCSLISYCKFSAHMLIWIVIGFMDFFIKKNLETHALQNAEPLTHLNSVFIWPLDKKKKKKISLKFVATNLYNNAVDNNSRAPSVLWNAESKLNQSYQKYGHISLLNLRYLCKSA